MNDQLAQYMTRQYPIALIADPEGGFAAEHPDLPGCFAQGETADEAVRALEASRRIWIEARLEMGLPIPEPTEDEDYSGRFVLRISRSAHAELARRATREGVSLNHYVSTVLAQHIGAASPRAMLETVNQQLQQAINELVLAVKQSRTPATTEVIRLPKNQAIFGCGTQSEGAVVDWITSNVLFACKPTEEGSWENLEELGGRFSQKKQVPQGGR